MYAFYTPNQAVPWVNMDTCVLLEVDALNNEINQYDFESCPCSGSGVPSLVDVYYNEAGDLSIAYTCGWSYLYMATQSSVKGPLHFPLVIRAGLSATINETSGIGFGAFGMAEGLESFQFYLENGSIIQHKENYTFSEYISIKLTERYYALLAINNDQTNIVLFDSYLFQDVSVLKLGVSADPTQTFPFYGLGIDESLPTVFAAFLIQDSDTPRLMSPTGDETKIPGAANTLGWAMSNDVICLNSGGMYVGKESCFKVTSFGEDSLVIE